MIQKKKKKDSATTDWLKECRRRQAEEIEKLEGIHRKAKDEEIRKMYEDLGKKEENNDGK